MRYIWVCFFVFISGPAAAADLYCGGAVSPGLAYPDAQGHWRGKEIELCQKLAQRIGERSVFTPVLQDSDTPPATALRSVFFLPAEDIPAGYVAGPAIDDDYQAIMVPEGAKLRDATGLANASICVEPGSPEDFNLVAYFKAHKIPLREFVFQETDEMHDAYEAGRCDAITARKSLLVGLRANEADGPGHDFILPDDLGDNPIRAVTPAGQADWAKIVDTTIEENPHD
jgi:general L-amino acid transport system substrate-binding protein